MNILDLFTNTYGVLRNYNHFPTWLLSPIRVIIRKLANRYLPIYLYKPIRRKGKVKKELIVSLTSFPARINDVWKVVECLKNQTVLPEKIILWLSKDQFPSENDIPKELKKQIDDLFEIRMVDGDIRSHKKYYYMLRDFPNKDFITCDDDVYYDSKMIERLIVTALSFPQCIIANKTSKICFYDDGNVRPYREWRDNEEPLSSCNLLQIGVGGVLYPHGTLHEITSNMDLFWTLSPLADDIWLNAMSRLKHTPVVQTRDSKLVLPITSKAPSLHSVNNGENMNDRQIQSIRDFMKDNCFPDIYSSSFIVKA